MPGGRIASLRLRVRRVFGLILLGALIALVITTAATYVDRSRLQPRIDRYAVGSAALDEVRHGMVDQETALRGFLATHEGVFLEPYVSGQRAMRHGQTALATALGDTADLTAATVDLRLAQQAWSSEWADRAIDPATSFASTADLTAFLGRGRTLFDTYRQRNEALHERLSGRLSETRATQQSLIKVRYGLEAALLLLMLFFFARKSRQLERDVARPLNGLLATIERLRRGDLSVRPAADGPEEFRALAEGLSEMATALESARAVSDARAADVEAHTEQLRVILTLARDISGSLSLRYVLDAVARSATTLSAFRRVRVWLVAEGSNRLTPAYDTDTVRGVPTTDPVDQSDEVVRRAARWGRVATAAGERLDLASDQVAFPMIVGARVVGVIELLDASPRLLPTETAEVLETMAVHAATAVEATRLHGRAQEQAEIDPLTQLFNRRRLEADLLLECERAIRYERPLAFVMLDADHFKSFNDTYGHQHGDELLQEFSELLRSAMRLSDSAYRYGGEEFCLLLRETGPIGGPELAERLRSQVEHRFTGRGIPLTASFGVAVLPGDGRTPADLVAAADRALYDAKRAGRNQVATSPSANPGASSEVTSRGGGALPSP
jgi:diguanylate cyclase (GGDEF)-like protein